MAQYSDGPRVPLEAACGYLRLLCTNFRDQNIREVVGNPTDESAILSLDHHPDEVFSAGVADQNATTPTQLPLRLRQGGVVTRERLERRLRRNLLIDKELRHGTERPQLRERASRLGEQFTKNKRC